MSALERAIVDVVGGPDAGHAFWLAALAKIDHAVARSRDREDAFCTWPAGEWGRLTRDLEEALELAATGVDVQMLVLGEPADKGQRRESIAEMLRARAAAVAARNAV
jgi:hypothetical protein